MPSSDFQKPIRCMECGMVLKQANERHPFAACTLFGIINDADAVRAEFPGYVGEKIDAE